MKRVSTIEYIKQCCPADIAIAPTISGSLQNFFPAGYYIVHSVLSSEIAA